MNAILVGFEKAAKLRIGGVEDELGMYLDREHHQEAEALMAQETQNRLGLKHPWLTGIPTLGLWPAMSHASGHQEVAHSLMRNNPKLRSQRAEADEISHRRRKDLIEAEVAQTKADAQKAMMANATGSALAGLGMYLGKERGGAAAGGARNADTGNAYPVEY